MSVLFKIVAPGLSLVPRTSQGSILLKLMQDMETEVVLDIKMG